MLYIWTGNHPNHPNEMANQAHKIVAIIHQSHTKIDFDYLPLNGCG